VCLGLAVLLSWGWVEPLLTYGETRCTVLDRRFERRPMRSSKGMTSGRSHYDLPVAAVRIETERGPIVATGFAQGWATQPAQALRFFPLGASVRCWTHPDDPAAFTLVRTPSLAALVGTLLLLGTSAVLALIARAMATGAPVRRRGSPRADRKRRGAEPGPGRP
jgi:hypothetical protein